MSVSEAQSDVAHFYSGKSVFLTGGTGFLGKALIEKLLYSTNIEKIYVLLRDKKNEPAHRRIHQITNSPAFERLKRQNAMVLNKLIPLSGDISSENFGLGADDVNRLENEVSIVFHLAASVNFNEPLADALNINVFGTKQVINLCQRLVNLQAFIHVSTAFSNSERQEIDEKVYSNTYTLEQVNCIAENFPTDDEITKKLLGNKPNTYTFTKSLAEEMVLKECSNMPVAIVRPSIVISAQKEPSPGWIDNWNGATGLFVGMSSGVMKVMVGRGSNITDLVPLDIVTNLSLVAATRCKSLSKFMVYNCCTGTSNPITCAGAERIARRVTSKRSLNEFPLAFMIFTSSEILYRLLRFILQLIPAVIIDFWALLWKKKAKQMLIQQKISKIVELMQYFLLNEWHFADTNVRNLLKTMSKQDKIDFNFDVKTIVWEKCLENYILGARKYLLKKTDE